MAFGPEPSVTWFAVPLRHLAVTFRCGDVLLAMHAVGATARSAMCRLAGHEIPSGIVWRTTYLAPATRVSGSKVAVGLRRPAERKTFFAGIEVEFFEPMGSDTLVWTSIGGQSFHFRLDGQTRIPDGERMTVGLDIVRGSILDRVTEARL